MLSPFMTVVVLAVLWLIVVVPMIVRRGDGHRRERSVENFGRAMRALGKRTATVDADHAEVFVPRQHRANLAAPARRPVPAAQEALMYPPDRGDLSEARTRMLSRRRRSLFTLIGGSLIFAVAGVFLGGAMWLISVAFAVGLLGYLWFLRSQTLKDRTRRESRQQRAATRRPQGYDATADVARFVEPAENVVRIDDDDITLHSMDTIDLTGLYTEELAEATSQRRAS